MKRDNTTIWVWNPVVVLEYCVSELLSKPVPGWDGSWGKLSGQIMTTYNEGHPKMWFSKDPPQKNTLNSGLGIVVICPV